MPILFVFWNKWYELLPKTGYKQTSKNPKKKNNKIATTLPFYSQQAIHTLGRNLDKEIEVKTKQ